MLRFAERGGKRHGQSHRKGKNEAFEYCGSLEVLRKWGGGVCSLT